MLSEIDFWEKAVFAINGVLEDHPNNGTRKRAIQDGVDMPALEAEAATLLGLAQIAGDLPTFKCLLEDRYNAVAAPLESVVAEAAAKKYGGEVHSGRWLGLELRQDVGTRFGIEVKDDPELNQVDWTLYIMNEALNVLKALST